MLPFIRSLWFCLLSLALPVHAIANSSLSVPMHHIAITALAATLDITVDAAGEPRASMRALSPITHKEERYFEGAAMQLELESGHFTIWIPYAVYPAALHQQLASVDHISGVIETTPQLQVSQLQLFDAQDRRLDSNSQQNKNATIPSGKEAGFYLHLALADQEGQKLLAAQDLEFMPIPRLRLDKKYNLVEKIQRFGRNLNDAILPASKDLSPSTAGTTLLVFYAQSPEAVVQVTCTVTHNNTPPLGLEHFYRLDDCERDDDEGVTFALGTSPLLDNYQDIWRRRLPVESPRQQE